MTAPRPVQRAALLLATCALLALPASASAGLDPSPWRLPSAPGFTDAIFSVMFSAQPAGIDGAMIDASDPTAPVFTVHASDSGKFVVAFGISNATGTLSQTPMAGAAGTTMIDFEIFRAPVGGAPQLAYTAAFSFGALLVDADLILNESPPPEFPDALGWARFSLVTALGGGPPSASSEVAMTLRLTDANGGPVALQAIPEPATLALLGLGLAGLAATRRRKQ